MTKLERYHPNQAPVNIPQVKFEEGGWVVYQYVQKAHTHVSNVQVQAVSAWKGVINIQRELNRPDRPVWFLCQLQVSRRRIETANPADTPRTRAIWVATDGESWYRVGNPGKPKSHCGRRFIPCDITLAPSARDAFNRAIKKFIDPDSKEEV